jgi:hypothetical protein
MWRMTQMFLAMAVASRRHGIDSGRTIPPASMSCPTWRWGRSGSSLGSSVLRILIGLARKLRAVYGLAHLQRAGRSRAAVAWLDRGMGDYDGLGWPQLGGSQWAQMNLSQPHAGRFPS